MSTDKVFRELFGSGPSVNMIDSQGGGWRCDILAETRNDMRLQYTLGVRHIFILTLFEA